MASEGHLAAWLAVVGLGIFHGVNPAMGWLFAVSNGMQARRTARVFSALPSLFLGHLLSMGAVLLPLALAVSYMGEFTSIKLACGLVLACFGLYKFVNRRHPRYLARVGAGHLAFWSFLCATAHGAGLMLLPVFLALCVSPNGVHRHGVPLDALANGNVAAAMLVVFVHSAAMIGTAGAVAWLVYRYLGLRLLQRGWLNMDLIWALFLIVAGCLAMTG